MYTIEEKPFGLKLTFSGYISAEEMENWFQESREILTQKSGGFGVFVDMRTLIPLPSGPRKIMIKGQKFYKTNGMVRSVVILSNPVLTLQFKQIAHNTGIYAYERYIDASHEPEWERVGLEWLENEIDPDKRPRTLLEA